MKYTAPDGHIIESVPTVMGGSITPPPPGDVEQPVTYECPVGGVPGVYISYETTAAATTVGIRQIKIVRVVTEETTTITITESTEEELQAYKASLVTDNNSLVTPVVIA